MSAAASSVNVKRTDHRIWFERLQDTPRPTESDPPVEDSDLPPADSDETDLPVDSTPVLPAWTVHVEPQAPLFDEDLRCVIEGLDLAEPVTLTWERDGLSQPAMVDGTRSGDTVPHLRQAGGQAWVCIATDRAGTTHRSTEVTVQHIVPMTAVPAGAFRFSRIGGQDTTLTRSFWLAQTELTQATWARFGTFQPVWDWPGGDRPAHEITQAEAMEFTNQMSIADGLAPCYACGVHPNGVFICAEQPDPYGCEGYRLPTWAEWEYAGTEAGRHKDPLPAGGRFPPPADPETGYIGDQEAVGPNAPPGTTVGTQCWASFNNEHMGLRPVGQKMPNRLQLYDMCGNADELVHDQGTDFQLSPNTDPLAAWSQSFGQALGGGIGSGVPYLGNFAQGSSGHTGRGLWSFRIARTISPVPLLP